MKPLAECRLYAFVDTAYLSGRLPAEVARDLCDGGADLIQLRAKGSTPGAIQRMAETLVPITHAAGVRLVINDHPEVARSVGAEVCHLGQEDFFDPGGTTVAHLRNPEGPTEIGLSSHAPAQALRAAASGADYVAVGPIFPTGTKPGRPAVTLEYVRWAAAHLRLPWFAIGGITLDNLDAVLNAGATRICVVSAILNTPDVAQSCREFLRRLPTPGPGS
ncbi:MAG: thiamine phosphate synthase [Verrucomicrobia bacterium]|nr:thiamine phosphate synthase [Verrucomicrobiota bacterium]